MNNNQIHNMQDALSVLGKLDQIDFNTLVKSLYNHKVEQINLDDPEHERLINKLEKSANIAQTRAFEKGIYRKRANEVGNDMENFIEPALNKVGYKASTPIKRNGKKQSTGYPDFYCETDQGKPFYLEIKTYNRDNIDTTQRSFYLSPPSPGNEKVNHDAPHIMLSFEIELIEANVGTGNRNLYKPVSWKLVSLYNLKLKLKSEFNSSNINMYNNELIISEK